MKRIFLFLMLMPFLAIGQKTVVQLQTQNNSQIKNKGTSQLRSFNMYDSIIQSSANLLGSYTNPSWITSLANTKITGLGTLSTLNSINNSNWSGTALAHSNIAATAVTPGSYTNANITVAADGSITAASNGSSGGGNPFADNTAILKNNADNTKLLKVDLSNITTGTIRTLKAPNLDGTIATVGLLGQAYSDNGWTWHVYGDSYITATGATTVQRGFYTIVTNVMAQGPATNHGVSGTGWLRAVREAYINISPNTTSVVHWVHTGYNDARRNGSASKTIEKVKSCSRAFIANAWLTSAIAANNASVTTSGTWSTTSGIQDKASLNLGGLVRTSTANGATLTYTFSVAANQSLVIGTFSTDEVTTLGDDFTYTIDGGSSVTYTGKNKTDGITDGTYDNSICPNAIIVSGLSVGSHTVVITTVHSTGTTRVDYFGIMADPRYQSTIIIDGLQKQTAAGYATAPANGSDAAFDATDEAMKSVINEVTGTVYFNQPNDFWNINTDFGGDNVHPVDLGYYHLAQSVFRMFKVIPNKFIAMYALNTDSYTWIRNGNSQSHYTVNRNPYTLTFVNGSNGAAGIELISGAGTGSINFYGTSSSTYTQVMTLKMGASTAGLGINVTSPTSFLHLGASSTTANTGGIKYTSGAKMTTAEAGTLGEYDGINLYWTPTGTTREVVEAAQFGRATAQTGANASVVTRTVGANDASFDVSANVNLTASTTNSFTVTVTYTDETNTSRTSTFSFVQNGVAVPIQTITNTTGVGAYSSNPLHIRCKASTTITIATTGTFTSVTYNVEGRITPTN